MNDDPFFSALYGLVRTGVRVEVPPPSGVVTDQLLGTSIADYRPQLPVRARKSARRLGAETIGDLIRHTGDELLETRNFGPTTLREVKARLAVNGLRLRED